MKKEIIGLENTKVCTLPVITKNLISQADDLAEEHEQFNATYIVGGRLALYDLLAKIFTLYQELDAAPDKSSLLGSMKHKMVHTYRIRVQSNSSDVGILVRYITRADRKTAHVYARVIETAIANKISIGDFAGYIQKSGGIEKMRSIGVDPILKNQQAESEKTNWDLGWKYCMAREELPFAIFESPKDFCKRRDVSFEYYACIKRGGKRYVIANIPADPIFDDRAIQLIGNNLSAIENADALVGGLYDKAMEMRKERFAKEMPELAKILENNQVKLNQLEE
jgi:hypothetical protein